MSESIPFTLEAGDYIAFLLYFAALIAIGYITGRKKNKSSTDYFLAGRSLPWYVVGSTYIAANISSEQFIGMIGAAYIYGICVATPEWSAVIAFSFLIWVFIPFLLNSKIFTGPEFLEQRFNRWVRDAFALLTIFMNIIVIMGAVLYGGALSIQEFFHLDQLPFLQSLQVNTSIDPIWFSILLLGSIAGIVAVYGGLKSVAWMDVITVAVMIFGGLTLTVMGWMLLGNEDGNSNGLFQSIKDGFGIMIERNKAEDGQWLNAVQNHISQLIFGADESTTYNRLSVLQPLQHRFFPWIHWAFSFFYVGLWYMVINQFMIQRIFAAKNIYHARVGIVFASYIKILLPFIVAIPGLILFAHHPEYLSLNDWDTAQQEADKGYVRLLQIIVPVGLRGLFLAAVFGAIQSTISAVLNSTSTVFTFDVVKRFFRPDANEKSLVKIGRLSSVVFLFLAMFWAYWLAGSGKGLFYYVQMFYSLAGPPFSALFLLGSIWPRINGKGAIASIVFGFSTSIILNFYSGILPSILGYEPQPYLSTFPIQALISWIVSMVSCTVVSLMTAPPRPEQVRDHLTFRIRSKLIKQGLGDRWYSSVTLWWAGSITLMFGLIIVFGIVL